MTSQHKKYVTLTLIALLICLMVIAANIVLFSKIHQIARQIQETKENLVHWQKKEVYSRQLAEEYEKITPDLELINQGFLQSNQVVDFIEKLEDLSRLHQIQQEIKQADKKEEEGVLILNLTLEGNFLTTLRYLTLLENLDNYTKINKLKIDASQEALIYNEIMPTPRTFLKTALELIVFLTPSI